MSFRVQDFSSDLRLEAMIHNANPNRVTELNAIATALGSDITTHDVTLQTPPAALMPGLPSHSRFTNDVLAAVNKGKAGNLTNAQMATAITSGIASYIPPANTALPTVSGAAPSGSILSVLNGTWTNSPSSYRYQWLRAGAPIFGATSASYTSVVADKTFAVGCMVTAINAAGSTDATSSNSITVT